MKTINEIRNITATQEYDKHFWNAMRLPEKPTFVRWSSGKASFVHSQRT